MKVHRSARKHGVLPEDAVQAADLALWIEPLEEEEWPHREVRLGFDTQARLLETVVLIFRSGEETAIHAMPARRQYLDLLP
ncbi:toxin [Ornithinimicrobium sp. LYQ121]|uniref:toxin n=1 Tax=Ornithinimicrobium sp. LYQ121 TaxID=3378801 RepID=UPI0038537238